MQTQALHGFQDTTRTFAANLKSLQGRATVVGLYGELGAGKTTFLQAAARALGVTVPISSPTFLIFKKYPLSRSSSPSLERRMGGGGVS